MLTAATASAGSRPEWLILCINNFCNLKCRMCDVGVGERASVFFANMIGDDPGNMSLDLLKQTLDSAMAFRPRPKIGARLHRAADPRPDPRLLPRDRQPRASSASITSNGFLLPQQAEALVEIGVDEIAISIDGAPEVHDRIRGRKGSFARLYEGIEKLNAARTRLGRTNPRVRISSTINDLNYDQLQACLEAVAPLQPDSVNFAHLSFITDGMAATHNARYDGEFGRGPLLPGRDGPGEHRPAAPGRRDRRGEGDRARRRAGPRWLPPRPDHGRAIVRAITASRSSISAARAAPTRSR